MEGIITDTSDVESTVAAASPAAAPMPFDQMAMIVSKLKKIRRASRHLASSRRLSEVSKALPRRRNPLAEPDSDDESECIEEYRDTVLLRELLDPEQGADADSLNTSASASASVSAKARDDAKAAIAASESADDNTFVLKKGSSGHYLSKGASLRLDAPHFDDAAADADADADAEVVGGLANRPSAFKAKSIKYWDDDDDEDYDEEFEVEEEDEDEDDEDGGGRNDGEGGGDGDGDGDEDEFDEYDHLDTVEEDGEWSATGYCLFDIA
jgi:hypothetical protein